MKGKMRRALACILPVLLLAVFPVPAAFAADACDGCRAGTFVGTAACQTANDALHLCEKNIPDENFRRFLAEKYDADGDGGLSEKEVVAVASIVCPSAGIADLTGICYFPRLTELNCSGNLLRKLELSANKTLKTLDCSDNPIAMLRLTDNTALTSLKAEGLMIECPYNKEKKSVDISSLIGQYDSDHITSISARDADGGEIEVNEAGGVMVFSADDPLYADYSVNTGLSGEGLNAVTVRVYPYTDGEFASAPARTAAGRLLISEKNFPDPAFRRYVRTLAAADGYTLTAAELAAKELRCADSGIGDMTGLAFFAEVETLDCSRNALTVLPVSSCAALKELNCSDNRLTALLLGEKDKLETLRCGGNRLIALDLSGCKGLKALDCSANHIASLDLSANTALVPADVKLDGQTLDKLSCAKVKGVYVLDLSEYVGAGRGENITSVSAVTAAGVNAEPEYSGSTGVVRFRYEPARVTYRYYTASPDQTMPRLEVSAETSVTTLSCVSGVFNGSDAYVLDGKLHLCDKNFPDEAFLKAVRAFDTDGDGYLSEEEAGAVKSLSLNSGEISSLKGVAYFTALTSLSAADNALSELDLSKNTALTALNCAANRLRTLDLSANVALEAAKTTLGSQTGSAVTVTQKDDAYSVSLTEAVGADRTANVKSVTDRTGTAAVYDPATGAAVFEAPPEGPITYRYDTGAKNGAAELTVVCALAEGALHAHTALTFVPAKPATCTEDGHAAYYVCSCGKYFADDKAANEIADLRFVRFPALNHASGAYSASVLFHWNACVNEGCGCLIEDSKKPHTDADGDGCCDVCGSDAMTTGVLGDVDGDGALSPADARLALRISIDLEPNAATGSVKYITSDVDLDDKVTPADARLILRASVELEKLKDHV